MSNQINWDDVRNRINSAIQSMEKKDHCMDLNSIAILKERAKELSTEIAVNENVYDSIEILQFSLAYETYGIETQFIDEVIPLKQYIPIPHTPKHFTGVIHYGGRILALIDLRYLFQMNISGLTNLNTVIIVSIGSHEFGILADDLKGIVLVQSNQLIKSVSQSSGTVDEFSSGLTEDSTIILDMHKLVSDKNMLVK